MRKSLITFGLEISVIFQRKKECCIVASLLIVSLVSALDSQFGLICVIGLVIDSLKIAMHQEKPSKGLIIHTDQGCQYTGHRFYECAMKYHFIHSQSRKGNPYDNAVMESFYKLFKRETLPEKQFSTKSQVTLIISDYLETYYNYKRVHSSLNYLTPYEFEKLTN